MNHGYVCRTCGDVASCVGWYFHWQVPEGCSNDVDDFYCSEHCDHDMCAGVEERIKRGELAFDGRGCTAPPCNIPRI